MQDFADSDIWELMPLDVSAKASGQQAPLETPNVSSDVFELGALEHEELGFVEGIKDVFGAKLLPFVGAAVEAKHLANLHSAVKRVEEGTQSEEDEQLLVEFLRLQQRAGRGGVGYKVATILAELPAFVAEFAAGGAAVAKAGAKVAAAKAVKEAVEKAARKSAQMAVAKWGVSKGVARAGAGIAKTSLMAGAQLGAITAMGEATGLAMAPFQGYSGGSRISANAWRRALPDMALSGDESTQLTLHFYNTADEFLDALPTAVADEYIEILSERSGAGIRSAFQKLPGADQVAVMQASVARWWTQKYGEGAAAKLMKRIAKAGGWDGVLEEFAEERLGGFLRGATGVEEGGILANTFPDLEQMAAELIAFSVPGAASSALRAFTDQRTSPMLGTGLEGVMPTGADAARVAGQGRLTEEDYGAIQGDLLDRGIDVVEPTTPEQRRVVEKGNRLGIDVILVQGQDGKALPVQALTPREGVVLIDVNAEAGLDYNFSHEWIHDLEKKHKPLHDALVNRVRQLDPEGYARWLEDYKERYRQQFGRELPETAEDTEGLAGYHDAHKALMFFAETEEGQRALSQLLQNDRTLAQEMLDWLKETVNKLTGWKLKTTMEKRLDMIAQQLGKEQVTLSEASIAFTFGQVIRELYGRFESPISRRAAALPEAARPRLGQGGRVQVYEPPVEPRQAPREVEPEAEPEAEPEPELAPEPQPEPEPEPQSEPESKPKPIPRRAPAEEEAPKAKPQVEAREPDIAKARRNRLYSNLNQTIERFDRAELGDDEAQEAEALVERARSIRDQVAAPGAVEDFASVEAEGRQIITRLRELYAGAKAQPAAPAEKVAEQPKPASQEEAPEPSAPRQEGEEVSPEDVRRFEIGDQIIDEMPRVGGIREADVEEYTVIAVNDDNEALVRVEWVPNPNQREPRTQVRYQTYKRVGHYYRLKGWKQSDPLEPVYTERRIGRPYRPDLLPQKWQKLLTPEAWRQWQFDASQVPERAAELEERVKTLDQRQSTLYGALFAYRGLISELENLGVGSYTVYEERTTTGKRQPGAWRLAARFGDRKTPGGSRKAGSAHYQILRYDIAALKGLLPQKPWKPRTRSTEWLLFSDTGFIAKIKEGKRVQVAVDGDSGFLGYFTTKKEAIEYLQSPDGPVAAEIERRLQDLRAKERSLENRLEKLRQQQSEAEAARQATWEELRQEAQPGAEAQVVEPAIPEEPPVVPERPGAQIGWDTTSERAERWSNYYADEFHFKGNRSVILLPDGRKLPVTYMLVDVTDLLPTHDEQTFQPNPGADINERQYQDAKLASASREMVQRIAENPDPKQLYSNSVTAVEGPPIVTPHGIVLGGNARTMGMQRAHRLGGKNADVLGKAAFFAAEEFGIYEQMDMDRGDFYRGWRTEYNLPVIVRVIDESHMGNPGELSRVLNDQHTAERSLGSDAVGRAARLDGDAATLLGVLFSGGKEGGKRTFADIVNDARLTAELVNILVKAGAWTAQDTGRSVDAATGKLNQGGREVIQRTLLAAAVDNVQDAAAVFKLAPAQLNKLMASVPSLIRARSYDARVAQVFGDVVDGLVALNSYPGTLQELVAQQEIGDPATWKQNTLAHRFIETFLGLKQREWVKRMSQLALDLQDYASGQTSLFGGGAQMTFERAMLNAVQNEADSNPSGKQGVRDQENREQRETQQRNNEDYMPPRGKRKKGEEPLYSLPRPDNYADAAGDYRQFLDEQGVSPANTSEIVRQLRDRHVAQAGDDFDAEDAAFADLENPESQYRQFERQFLLDIADGRIGWGIGWVDRGQEGSVDPEEADPTNDYQVVYEPASQMRSLGTVVPKNMRSAMKRALRDFQKQNGSVDEYVARELGWTAEQTADRLGAEQVDAVALGISQLKQGKGFILGAQTGVGKGRVVGALELWAIRNNLLPIFVTEGHGLFQAAWRDRSSIGSEGQVRPYALSWQASPVQVSPGFTWHPNERHGPNAMSTEKAIKSRRKMIKYAQINGRLPESGPNAIWATYTDFNQKGKRDNPMTHPLVRALAPNAVFILDESHNMIGQETKQGDRADVMQDMVAKSKGAVYSSATFAKTPYALRMFMKTDLGIVGANGVATTVKQGGRALEQHVNLMLANAGQLVRYERSYTGIQFNDRVVPAKDEQGVSRMDAVAKLVRRIRTIDVEALKAARQTKQAEVRAEMEPDLQPGDQSRYRYNSQSYVNIIHDVTRAALMAVKADDVVEVAVEEVAKGRKPVIFADMTGESGVQRWLEKNPDNEVGSEIKASDISFAEYLDYAIDRLRTISVSDPELETNVKTIERHVITDDELRAYGLDWAVDEIQDIMKQARETLSALPGSPYDYVYDRLTQAGVKVGELSGRSVRVAYKGDPRQDDTVAVIESRQMSAADRNKVRDEFNNGLRDVLLYNSSAATGVDMHAGETFADQRQRVFLGWQAAQDVTVQVQAFGRINRTGQMTQPNDNARLFPKAQYGLPEYYMVYADVPVEQKVRAILSATMQQLGALTTGSSRSATNLEAVDPIMNKYGDAAAAEALQQIDPGILEAIDMEPKLSPGLARRMANRSLALTVAQQQELFDLLDSNYQAIVEQLNAEGRNDIESEVLDVDAVTVRAFVHQHATGRSPFQQPIVEERIDMKLDQLPLTSQQMQARRAADFDAKVAQLYDTIGVAGNQYAQLMEQRESDLAAKIAEVDRARNGLSGRVMSGEITPSRAEALRVTLDAEIRSLNAQAAGARASARDKRNKVDQMFSVLAQVQLSSKAATKYVAQFAGGSRKDFYGYITDISGPNTDDPAKLLQPGRYYIEYYSHESPDPMRLPFNLMWQGMPVTEKLLPAQLSDIDSRSEQIRKTGRIQKSFLTGNLLQAYAQYSDLGRAVLVRDEFGRHRSGILLHDIRDLDTQTGKYPVMAPAATVEQLLEIAQRARQNQQFLEPHDAYVKYPNAHLRFLIDFSADTNDPGYLSLELQMSSIEDSPDEIQVEVMGRKHALGQALKAMPGVSDARVQKWWIDPYSWGGPKANGLRATLTRAQINTLLEKIPGERRAQVYYVGSRKDRLANHLRPKTTGIGKMYFAKPLDIPFEDLGAAIGQQLDGPQEVMDLNWLDEALYSLRRSGKGRARRKDQRIALSFDVGTETWLDRMRRRFQDRDIRWKRLEEAVRQAEGTLTDAESVYLAQELYPGRTEARVEDWNERHYVKIVDWMHKHNISLNDADLYLYARHAEERNEYIKNKRLKEWRTNELRRIRREAQSEATRAQASLDKELAKEKPSRQKVAALQEKLADALRLAANPYAALTDPPADTPFLSEDEPGSGMRTKDARKLLAEYEKENDEGYRGLGKLVDAMNRETRDRQVRAGLTSQETADEWEEQFRFYVPLRTNVEPGRETVGKRFDTGQTESREAWGRRSLAFSPLSYSIQQGRKSVIRAEKNRIGQTLLRLIDSNKELLSNTMTVREEANVAQQEDGEFMLPQISEPKEGEFSTKVQGKIKYIRISDPLLLKSINGMSMQHPHNAVRLMAAVVRMLSRINTSLDPEFMLRNFVRDLQTAGLNLAGSESSKMAAQVVKDTLSGKPFKAIVAFMRGKYDPANEWHRAYNELRSAGGLAGWFYMPNIDQTADSIHKDLQRNRAASGLRAFGKFIEDSSRGVENGVRLAAYYRARRAGATVKQAASLAKNLTVNFNRQGEWGQVLNSFYMFYNASIQGTRTMLSVMRNRKAQRFALGIVASSMILDAVNAAISDDDEFGVPYYDKIPLYERERNLILMLEGDDYMKIPLPYGYNLFHAIGQVVGLLNRDVISAPEALSHVAGTAYGAFFPFGSEATLLQAISPTLLDPVVQIHENKTFYGAPLRPPQYGSAQKPAHQQYWQSVSPVSKKLTSWLNTLGGGDEVTPSPIWGMDVSPESLDHVMGFVTGGAGRTAGRLVRALFDRENTTVRDIPFARTVMGEADRRYDQAKYYKLRDEVTYAKRRYEAAIAEKDLERIAELRREDAVLLRMVRPLRAAETRLRKLRDFEDRAQTPQQKEQVKQAMQNIQSALIAYLYRSKQ